MVRSRTNPARVIHEARHFTDLLIFILLLRCRIYDWGQEARRDTWHWHFLQTWIRNCGGSAAWRDCLDHSNRIDDRAWALAAWAYITRQASLGHSSDRIVASRSWLIDSLLIHLDLRDILFDCRILLGSNIYVPVVYREEFVLRAHSRERCSLFKDADFTLIGARAYF